MTANRRDIIKASASIGVLAVSEASALAAAPKVLMVSSIPLTGEMTTSFTNGAASVGVGVVLRPQGDLRYAGGDTTNIENFIKGNHGSHNLIVTTGGSITHVAAKKSHAHHNKNWIALLGDEPDPSDLPDNFLGGVVLGSYISHIERALTLQDKSIPRANIYLYTNKSSAMHAAEVKFWKDNIGNTVIEASKNNDPSTYATDFPAFPAAVRGLVISADPFFASTRTDLIRAANTWLFMDSSRRVCYPLQVYENLTAPSTDRPRSGQSTLYGPATLDAYSKLGQLAGIALNQKKPGFLGYWQLQDHRKDIS